MKILLGTKPTSWKGYYVTFKSIFTFWDIVERDLKKGRIFCLVSKLHESVDITELLRPSLLSETFLNIDKRRVEISALYGNYIKRRILCTFSVHFCFLTHSRTWLKKWMNFLLGIKTTSSRGYYVIFKSTFPLWDMLEHHLKNGWNFCLV